jgi:BA14K-like protein
MRPKLVLAISTLVLGTALAAIPAVAQNSGPANGNARQGAGCATHFQTACSDQPYPMAQPAGGGSASERGQYNGAQREQRTGSAQNGDHARARSAALGSAGANDRFGEANGRGRYYDYAPGPMFAGGAMNAGSTAACAARFHSYNPETGTYMGFDGIRHPCP